MIEIVLEKLESRLRICLKLQIILTHFFQNQNILLPKFLKESHWRLLPFYILSPNGNLYLKQLVIFVIFFYLPNQIKFIKGGIHVALVIIVPPDNFYNVLMNTVGNGMVPLNLKKRENEILILSEHTRSYKQKIKFSV